MTLQNRIKKGMNGANKMISLTHKSRLGDHNAASVSMVMHTSVSLSVALAAEMHSGQGAKLEDFPDEIPLYMEASIEYSMALFAWMMNLLGPGCATWLVH